MNTKTLFSSKSSEWETPANLYAVLDEMFHFTLDPCATAENAKCPTYFTVADDGLVQTWHGRLFVNPPYGRTVGRWVQKCYEEFMDGHAELVVALLPARTDTKWFHAYVAKARCVLFLQGRLRFVGAKYPAPFPSMLAVWSREEDYLKLAQARLEAVTLSLL